MKFTRAITRLPSSNFADGITTSIDEKPDLDLALRQHTLYCLALDTCGLEVDRLDPDPEFPDATFVEDTAILTADFAIMTLPGASSRRDETIRLKPFIKKYYAQVFEIQPPGTLDGGDICQVEDLFFIGLSKRTNESGAEQLKSILESGGYRTKTIDIRQSEKLLHLKSGLAYIGENILVLTEELAEKNAFSSYKQIVVNKNEAYAANCIRINDHLLIAQGYTQFEKELQLSGYQIISLNMSEFKIMDGGLSCLSLRF